MTTLADIPLSMFNLMPVCTGGSAVEALHNSLDLARYVERLGFNRFWLAEYHNMDGIASSATALLIGHIAGGTSRTCVGSGGVTLPNHASSVVAENLGTLETLYPGRIDLGLGRTPGADQVTMCALRRDRPDNGDDLPEQVAGLETLLDPRRSQQSLLAVSGEGIQVPIWLLGLSLLNAHLAAQKSLPCAFASHLASRYLHEALYIYRSNSQPSTVLDKPYAMIGVPLVAAPADEEAEFLATTAFQRVLALIRGESLKQKPPVKSMVPLWLLREQDAVGSFFGLAVVGGPEKVRARLEILPEQTSVDELIFISDFYEHVHWLRSREVVAGLKGARSGSCRKTVQSCVRQGLSVIGFLVLNLELETTSQRGTLPRRSHINCCFY